MEVIDDFVSRVTSRFTLEIGKDQRRLLTKTLRKLIPVEQLEKLTPLERKLMVDRIEEDYTRSLVEPGKLVGNIAAQSIGESKTQETLDAHRSAGLASGREKQSGLARTKEVFEDTTSKPSMLLFPNRMLSLMDIKRLMTKIQYTIVGDVILKTVVAGKDDPRVAEKEWHQVHQILNGPYTRTPWILRIVFDAQKLYDKRISLTTISSLIESSIHDVFTIHSDKQEATIDIFYLGNESIPGYESIATTGTESMYYVRDAIIPSIRGLVLCGVKGIDAVFPDSIPMASFVLGTAPGAIKLNKHKANLHGIQPEWIEEWVREQLGLDDETVVKVSPTLGKVMLYPGTSSPSLPPPKLMSELLGTLDVPLRQLGGVTGNDFLIDPARLTKYGLTYEQIAQGLGDQVTVEMVKGALDVKTYGPGSSLGDKTFYPSLNDRRLVLQEYWFLETNGINMRDIMYIDELNHNCTRCNSSKDMLEKYDIECNRAWKYDSAIESGMGSVSTTHVELVVDSASRDGSSIPMNRIGLAKMNSEMLGHANFEKNQVTFMELGMTGAADNINSPAAALITGRLARGGSSFPDIVSTKLSTPILTQTKIPRPTKVVVAPSGKKKTVRR